MDDTSMYSRNHSSDRFFKIISIISFFLILIVLTILLRVGPAASYEFSIYNAYPWYFWVLLLSAIVCGQVVIIGSVIIQSRRNYWLFGLCAILVINALLLFIPIIRGYFIYGIGDVPTHIGFLKDILQSSSIGESVYPIIHILGVSIHLFSGLSFPDITLIIPPFFSFFFIFSLYFLGKTIFQNNFELLLFVILSLILMVGSGQLAFVPNAQAFCLIPLILYLALKMHHGSNTKKFHFLLLLISLLIVFYHPLVTVMVIFILCIMQITQYILEKYQKGILKKANYTYAIFFIIAVFSIWSKYIQMATNVVEPIIFKMLGEANLESELQKNINSISQVNIDPIYLLKLILNVYGDAILLGILSLLSIGMILKSIKNQKTKPDFFKIFSSMGFIVIVMISIALLVLNARFSFGRIYAFASLFSLLLIPTGVYLFLGNNSNNKRLTQKKTIKLLGVIVIVFCITYFSLFNLYNSPINKLPNQQVSRSDYTGISTFFTYRDESLHVLELGPPSFRLHDAIYGQSAKKLNIYYNEKNMMPPDHFGYQNATPTSNLSHTSKYLLLNDLGRKFYPSIFPEFNNNWRFLAEDFERLKSDTKIQQVYSNKNFEVFVI